jgi:phosphohistidine phosphatase
MFLYIVRHAWAYEHGDPRWPDDSQRPLEDEGVERFSEAARRLVARCDFDPAAIATSPYVRCRQTADILARYAPAKPEVVELDALRPGSDFDALVEWTRAQGASSVCWVGHAPDVGRLAAALLGDEGASVRFAKGAAAAFRIHGAIGAGAGELHWLAPAKVLGA